MAVDSKYICDSQQRIFAVLEVLIGHEVDGMATKDVAAAAKISQSTVYRDLMNLMAAGWAEQLEDGKWRLSVNASRYIRRINDGIMSALARVNKARKEYQDE